MHGKFPFETSISKFSQFGIIVKDGKKKGRYSGIITSRNKK